MTALLPTMLHSTGLAVTYLPVGKRHALMLDFASRAWMHRSLEPTKIAGPLRVAPRAAVERTSWPVLCPQIEAPEMVQDLLSQLLRAVSA